LILEERALKRAFSMTLHLRVAILWRVIGAKLNSMDVDLKTAISA
jgi:hypothetical protein